MTNMDELTSTESAADMRGNFAGETKCWHDTEPAPTFTSMVLSVVLRCIGNEECYVWLEGNEDDD